MTVKTKVPAPAPREVFLSICDPYIVIAKPSYR